MGKFNAMGSAQVLWKPMIGGHSLGGPEKASCRGCPWEDLELELTKEGEDEQVLIEGRRRRGRQRMR